MGDFKYSESDLKDRHIGRYIDWGGDHGTKQKYRVKKEVYQSEGVWAAYGVLRTSLRAIFQDFSFAKDGSADPYLCDKCTQLMMDSFLLRRCRGEDVQMPKAVVPVNAAPDEKMVELLNAEGCADGTNVTENQKIRWVYENMDKAGVKKEDAPSYGTYKMLLHYQGSEMRKEKFYDTMVPKLMTKEEAEKGGKLNDDGKETVQLIERLLEAAGSGDG